MTEYNTETDTSTFALPPTLDNFKRALFNQLAFVRYNVRSNRQQISWDTFQWQDLTDGIVARLREALATSPMPCGNAVELFDFAEIGAVVDVSKAKLHDLLGTACAEYAVDPLIEYIDGLPAWDGEPRLRDWIMGCFDVAEESLTLSEWAGTFIFLGAVWRAYQPGVKLDEMPILIGRGGIGKSTALRYIFPPELRELFTDGLHLAAQPKERVEAMQGKAVVEAAEMQGARRADLESLKAFLSRTDDGSVRLAYRRDPEPMPRRSIIVGTADRPDPLPDDPNLRRFVPITLNGGKPGDVMEILDAWRDDLWAEALAMYRRGKSAYLPDALKATQAAATEQARSKDSVLEDAISRWLEGAPAYFTLEQVAVDVGLVNIENPAKLSAYDSKRVAGVLRHQGYATKAVWREGKTTRRWAKT